MMLRLAFGATDVHVTTTSTLSRLLEATHRRHSPNDRPAKSRYAARSVSVDLAPPDRSPEYALRDAHREIAGEVAAAHGWLAIDAVVVERDGRALAITGAPGVGKSTVAAHLLARGWKLVTDDVAFIDEARGEVVSHHGLMHFRSGALPHLPSAFKATLERSRWFVDERGELHFYEVDPASVFGADVWSHEATLDAIVAIDDRASASGVETQPAQSRTITQLDGTPATSEVLRALHTGVIGRDRAVHLTDRIEAWIAARADAS
jgi:hypothetical protein